MNTTTLLIFALVCFLISVGVFLIATGLTIGQILTLIWDLVFVPTDPNSPAAIEWRQRKNES